MSSSGAWGIASSWGYSKESRHSAAILIFILALTAPPFMQLCQSVDALPALWRGRLGCSLQHDSGRGGFPSIALTEQTEPISCVKLSKVYSVNLLSRPRHRSTLRAACCPVGLPGRAPFCARVTQHAARPRRRALS